MTGTSAGWRALRWFAAGLLALDIVGALLYTAMAGAWSEAGPADVGGSILLALSYGLVGLLITIRRPQVPIGWLLLCCGALWSQGVWTIWPQHIVATGGRLAGFGAFVADGSWLPWPIVAVPAIQLTLLLLPDGRLRSRRWRPVAAVTVAAMLVATAALILVPGPVDGFPRLHHPGIAAIRPLLVGLVIGSAILLVGAAILGFAGLFVEYRRAADMERQQLRWLAIGGLGAVFSLSTGAFTHGFWSLLSGLGLAAIPMSIGVAVLRYRLYDLGRLLSRTVSYLLLTGVLLGVYVSIATAIGLVASGNTIGVAAGTLVAAALFRPLRTRLQAVVDRRFNRERYDAVVTVDAFSARLRDAVSTDSVVADLVGVTSGALEPSTVSIWLRPAL